MPFHFGALAGLGHCYAHEGKLVPALRCYEQALAINMNDAELAGFGHALPNPLPVGVPLGVPRIQALDDALLARGLFAFW